MGIRTFFKNTGNWLKDKFHRAANAVTKFGKVAAPIVKTGINFIDKTPIAPIVNAYTGGLFDKAKKIINAIPDGAVKDKLNTFTNKAEQLKDRTVDEINTRQQQAKMLIDRGREVLTS